MNIKNVNFIIYLNYDYVHTLTITVILSTHYYVSKFLMLILIFLLFRHYRFHFCFPHQNKLIIKLKFYKYFFHLNFLYLAFIIKNLIITISISFMEISNMSIKNLLSISFYTEYNRNNFGIWSILKTPQTIINFIRKYKKINKSVFISPSLVLLSSKTLPISSPFYFVIPLITVILKTTSKPSKTGDKLKNQKCPK